MKLSQPEVIKEVQIIADRYNLPYKVVEGIILVYFEQAAKVMASAKPSEDYYPLVTIPHLFKFIVKPGTKQRVLKYLSNLPQDEAKSVICEGEEGNT